METISRTEFINTMTAVSGWELNGNFPNQYLSKDGARINLYGKTFKINLGGVIQELTYTKKNIVAIQCAFIFIDGLVEHERAVS